MLDGDNVNELEDFQDHRHTIIRSGRIFKIVCHNPYHTMVDKNGLDLDRPTKYQWFNMSDEIVAHPLQIQFNCKMETRWEYRLTVYMSFKGFKYSHNGHGPNRQEFSERFVKID